MKRANLTTATARRAIIALLLPLLVCRAWAGDRQPIEVLKVVDGDTVVARVEGRRVRIRLLGVDAPEVGREGRPGEAYSRLATRFVRDRVAGARRVELEVAGDRVDAYGRTLGFLWLTAPGKDGASNLSEELVREGFARAVRHFLYPGRERFLALEAEARRARRGLWRKDLPR